MDVGDRVVFRFYNSVEKKFYGERHLGTILEVDPRHSDGKDHLGNIVYRPFRVDTPYGSLWIRRKEILRVEETNEPR